MIAPVIDAGAWRLAPTQTWEAIASIESLEARSELFEQLSCAAAAAQLDEPTRVVLALLSSQPASTIQAAEIALMRLLAAKQPNDAGRIIDAFERDRFRELPPISEELRHRAAKWLLQHGGAELVTAPRTECALRLAHYFASRDERDECLVSLRLVLANDGQLVELHGELQGQLLDLLQWVATRVEDPGWTFQLLEKALGGLGEAVVLEIVAKRTTDEASAKLADALIDAVLRGQLAKPLMVQAFVAALLDGTPAPEGEIADARAIDAGVEALDHVVTTHRRREHRSTLDGPRFSAWAEKLARRIVGHDRPALTHSRLGLAVGWNEAAASGVARALRDAWSGTGALADHPCAETARELLERAPEKHTVLAVLQLARVPWTGATGATAFPAEDVARMVERVIPLVAALRGQPFELLRRQRTRRLRFTGLADGAKVAFQESELLVDPVGPSALYALDLDERARLALVELYVVHELAHVAQEIGDKAVVEAMRTCGRGGETTLMHLDLSADHTAACALERVLYPDRLLWLKEIQGSSILGFPSGIEHTVASRFRKSLRLVSLRAELAARKAGLVAGADDTPYVFVDFNPVGGTFNVLENRPPIRLLGRSVLEKSDALFLSDCVGAETKLEKVDAAVDRLFAHMRRPGTVAPSPLPTPP